MEHEGRHRLARVNHFLNRPVAVNLQGRGFANAFAELRAKAVVPLIVLETSWESNLRPVTLHAEARWIDLLREVCRQVGLGVTGGDLVVVSQPNHARLDRLQQAMRRSRPQRLKSGESPRLGAKLAEVLAAPSHLKTSETPLSQALMYLETQHKVAITLLPPHEFNRDTPTTNDVDGAPLAAVLELVCTPYELAWIPVHDSILIAPAKRQQELEAKAAELRAQLARLKAAADKGDQSASRLMQATFMDFSESPLSQAVHFVKTQHNGPELEARAEDPDRPVTFKITGVPLHEGLALLAWSNGLTLTLEGTKAVLSSK